MHFIPFHLTALFHGALCAHLAIRPSHPRCVQLRLREISEIWDEVTQLPAVARVNAQLALTGGNIKTVDYTLVEWDGGSDSYQYCNLPGRAPAYEGVCTPAMVYTLTGVETAPYACTTYPNGTALTGSACTAQVDEQLDCKAVCECVTGQMDLGTISRGCSSDRCANRCICSDSWVRIACRVS